MFALKVVWRSKIPMKGINKKEEFIEHLDSHQEMAMNCDIMFRKFKEYVLAHEKFMEWY